MAVYSNAIGKELLEALGLQGMSVTAVTVHFEASQAVEVQVKFLPDQTQAAGVIEILKRYELHEKPDEPSA
ncbi:hypothetical protein IQ22_02804 [Pseudomonas duriflava]|uniref:Uncharacterized protein n=1 Tax=Pseudomonas duriflava TaxID=459528 RepID=A0A562Q8B1_9PSED|nr:hypothetical protein [Pseudomonas duriflava]TWI52969.1 hypothetical protein IQ22_02804 [Pseudomonas duriflava]